MEGVEVLISSGGSTEEIMNVNADRSTGISVIQTDDFLGVSVATQNQIWKLLVKHALITSGQ